jgi:hypothetical protein
MVHFFGLGAELKEQQVYAGAFEFTDAVSDLLRSSDQARAQAAVRYRVFF